VGLLICVGMLALVCLLSIALGTRNLSPGAVWDVAVLHDLNQAARYADHIVVMKAGRIVSQGYPREVVTAELIEDVFGLACRIIDDPEAHTPLIIPRSKQ